MDVLKLARAALRDYRFLYEQRGLYAVHCKIHALKALPSAEKCHLPASGAEPRYLLALPNGELVVAGLHQLAFAKSMGTECDVLVDKVVVPQTYSKQTETKQTMLTNKKAVFPSIKVDHK